MENKNKYIFGALTVAVLFVLVRIVSTERGNAGGDQSSIVPGEILSIDEQGGGVDSRSQKREIVVEYISPGGLEKIGIALSVDADRIITSVVVTPMADNDISAKLQKAFASELPVVLEGRKLSELDTVDVVGKASLTTRAFNESLAKLKLNI